VQKSMTKRIWLFTLGAALLVSAAPVVSAAGNAAAAQSSVNKKKSKRKVKRTPRGQKAPTSDRIREIQDALSREGALDGKPTGKWDATTIEAMKKYQESHGLSPTGKIDAVTLEKLGLGSDTAGKGAPIPTASTTVPPATSAH
jgi:peptidoglycan hydrolase-like protein with peptidoglycan-binding domain